MPTAATCGLKDELIALYETLEASLTQSLSDAERETPAGLPGRLLAKE